MCLKQLGNNIVAGNLRTRKLEKITQGILTQAKEKKRKRKIIRQRKGFMATLATTRLELRGKNCDAFCSTL